MGSILFKMGIKSAKYKSIRNQLENLFIQKKVDQKYVDKAFEYFEFCWRKNVIFDVEQSDFNDLSNTLQREVLVQIHKDIILNVSLFS